MLSDLYRISSSGRAPLRIGLLLNDTHLIRAFSSVIEDIQKSNFARIELLIINDAQPKASPSQPSSIVTKVARLLRDTKARNGLMWNLYNRWDAKFFKMENDPLVEEDCLPVLKDVECLRVTPIAKRFVHRFSADAVEAIQERQLDVLLRFGFNILRGDILTSAKYGVWSFHHGDNDYYRGGPAHFWELYEENSLSGVILQVLTEELDAGKVLAKGLFATARRPSLVRNHHQPYWGSTHFVIQKLWELHQHGWQYVESRCIPPAPYAGKKKLYRQPTNWEMVRWVAPSTLKRAAGHIGRRLTPKMEAHWHIAIRRGRRHSLALHGPADMSGFQWIESPVDHFYADPFLLQNKGKNWVFFEDFNYATGRAVINCAEIQAAGLVNVQTAIDTGKHASYPYLIEDAGELFMIPETQDLKAVRLYRCTRFPDEWRIEKTLFDGFAVDTSVFFRAGIWWFFVTMKDPRGEGLFLYLYFSDSLTGEWQSHPQNPISWDVRNARGAGRIYEEDGKLLRPSQDCSRRYGYSFSLNEILKLSPAEYEERPLITVEPIWHKGLVATHTYNWSGDLEVVDGLTPMPRSSIRS